MTVLAGELRLREAIERARSRFGLVQDARVVSCYEAGRDGLWLHRCLRGTGVENEVVDSSSVEVKRRRRRGGTGIGRAGPPGTDVAQDALADRRLCDEGDDPNRAGALTELRRELQGLKRDYAQAVPDNPERQRRTVRGFKIADAERGKQIRALEARIGERAAQRDTLPKKVSIREVHAAEQIVRLEIAGRTEGGRGR